MPKQLFSLLTCCVAAACIAATGCHLKPDWGPPGTMEVQRNRAAMNDPFPSNELGPPIMGGRPPGFEQPKSQADQLQSSPYARRGTRSGQTAPTYGF